MNLTKGQTRDPIWRQFEDPTYAGDILRRGQVYFPYIVPWNAAMILSSNSGDGALLGKIGAKEHKIWNMADHLRCELPVEDGADGNCPCVIGATWNYNSKRPIAIDDKTIPSSPSLLILSNGGILAKFELFNTMPDFPSMAQALDRVPSGERPALAIQKANIEDSKPKPRTSLQKTHSLFPQSTPKPTSIAPPATPATFIKPPIAQSTPAPALGQTFGSFSETASNDSTNIFSKTKTLESTVTHSRNPSHEIVTKPPRPAAIVTKAPQVAQSVATSGGKLTKRDLIDLGKSHSNQTQI